MKYQILCLVLFCSISHVILAQTETIRENSWGVEFKIPDGWQYQLNEQGYFMGSNSIAGLIMVIPSSFTTIEQLINEAKQGVEDEEGTLLQLKSPLVNYYNKGMAGYYSGTMQWETVEAYFIGLINKKGGQSITCMIVTTPDMFSDEHVKQLTQLANSFIFFKPKISNEVKEWNDWFIQPGGCRLKYLTSSGGMDYGGGYSGYSSQETIDLCPNGIFWFSSSSNSSFDTSGGFGSTNDGSQGNGQWKINFNGTNAVLALSFYDGRSLNYVLTYEDSKTYLEGYRYFVLFDDDGPQCD